MIRTLSHEIFQVVPFDIIGQIANIDAAVLLGRIAHGLHHLFFCGGTIFERSRWASTSTTGVA